MCVSKRAVKGRTFIYTHAGYGFIYPHYPLCKHAPQSPLFRGLPVTGDGHGAPGGVPGTSPELAALKSDKFITRVAHPTLLCQHANVRGVVEPLANDTARGTQNQDFIPGAKLEAQGLASTYARAEIDALGARWVWASVFIDFSLSRSRSSLYKAVPYSLCGVYVRVYLSRAHTHSSRTLISFTMMYASPE